MPKIRKTTKVAASYTMIHNDCFRGLLTAIEVALLGHCLSHVDGWIFEREVLENVFEDLGKTRLERALKGLRVKGFLQMTKLRNEGGRYEWDWDFTPDPAYAAQRAAANPEGRIIDLSRENPQVAPQPQNGGVVTESGQNGAKPDTPFPGDGEPGDGEPGSGNQGAGLYKEEKTMGEDHPKNTMGEDHPPPSVPPAPAAVPNVEEQGGVEDSPNPKDAATKSAVELIMSAVTSTDLDHIRAHERRDELVEAVMALMTAGVPAEKLVAVLGRPTARLNDIVAGLCGRLSMLKTTDAAPTPGEDPFEAQAATQASKRATPRWCGYCQNLGSPDGPKYRRVIQDDGSLGDICECHPNHPIHQQARDAEPVVSSR